MKRIYSVYNLKSHCNITIDTDGTKQAYNIDLSSAAKRKLFELLLWFLDEETARGRGFYNHATLGWFWLRKLEATK